jgi:all-trans-retinol 13,14-reductase
MQEVNRSVDLLNMDDLPGRQPGYFNYFSTGFNNYLNNLTGNQELINVLVGNSPLYAGVKDKTPLYIPMIINSTYIDSAYRFIDGGSQISTLLAGSIIANGGTIFKEAEVTKFIFGRESMKSVVVNDSEEIEAEWFISNIHPKTMLSLCAHAPLRPAYQKRIYSIEDTYGMFSLYLAMKENSFKYINSHYYIYRTDNVWHGDRIISGHWPESYMMHFSPGSKNEKYTGSVIVTAYLNWHEVEPWENTLTEKRGDDYNEFKGRKAETLLDIVEKDFPGIRSCIKSYFTSTPLTYRDYTGTYRGSVYGMLKDYNSPLKTLIMPKTKIPNLLLTGQNTNVHGVIGVTIGSVLTCGEILGTRYILDRIRNA